MRPSLERRMLPKDLLHMINNQLTVVMGKAQLLGLEVENQTTKETCREIQAAAAKINQLMCEYVNPKNAVTNKVQPTS